jgi:serine/threonine-protein kinase RsbW
MERTTINLRDNLTELARLRDLVDSLGRKHGWSAQVLGDVQLALEESATNVINYAFRTDGAAPAAVGEHEFTVLLDCTADELTVELEDDGQPFDPLTLPPPDFESPLEEMRVGGWGIHFVRQLMDDVAYRRQDGKNLLILKKRLTATGR